MKEKIEEIFYNWSGRKYDKDTTSRFAKEVLALFEGWKSPEEVEALRESLQLHIDAGEQRYVDLKEKSLDPSAPIICPDCKRSGYTGQQWPEYGMTDDGRSIPLGMNQVICPKCKGHGMKMKKCPECDGKGFRIDEPEVNATDKCDCKDGLIPMTIQDLIDEAWEEK